YAVRVCHAVPRTATRHGTRLDASDPPKGIVAIRLIHEREVCTTQIPGDEELRLAIPVGVHSTCHSVSIDHPGRIRKCLFPHIVAGRLKDVQIPIESAKSDFLKPVLIEIGHEFWTGRLISGSRNVELQRETVVSSVFENHKA